MSIAFYAGCVEEQTVAKDFSVFRIVEREIAGVEFGDYPRWEVTENPFTVRLFGVVGGPPGVALCGGGIGTFERLPVEQQGG